MWADRTHTHLSLISHSNAKSTTLPCTVGGQDRLRKLWRHYYKDNDALIFVIDAADRERLPVRFFGVGVGVVCC